MLLLLSLRLSLLVLLRSLFALCSTFCPSSQAQLVPAIIAGLSPKRPRRFFPVLCNSCFLPSTE